MYDMVIMAAAAAVTPGRAWEPGSPKKPARVEKKKRGVVRGVGCGGLIAKRKGQRAKDATVGGSSLSSRQDSS